MQTTKYPNLKQPLPTTGPLSFPSFPFSLSNKKNSFTINSCKSCLAQGGCVAWTHWYINGTQDYLINGNPRCNLFSTYPNDTNHVSSGNCVTGSPYDENNFPPRLNYVYHFPDTIRAESMSLYGHPIKTTPFLDSFASTGVTYNGHIVQHSQCGTK